MLTPNAFGIFIESRQKDSTGVAPLKKAGLNKANIMIEQFCSVYTKEDMSDLPDLP